MPEFEFFDQYDPQTHVITDYSNVDSDIPDKQARPMMQVSAYSHPGRLLPDTVEFHPADAAGRLEKEIFYIRKEGDSYQPNTYMGQRFQMAAQVRESVLGALEANGNDVKATMRGLKRERRLALKNRDWMTVDNAQREIGILRQVSGPHMTYATAELVVNRLKARRDPEVFERGLIRGIGALYLDIAKVYTHGIDGNHVPSSLNAFRSKAARAKRRRQVVNSIALRAAR